MLNSTRVPCLGWWLAMLCCIATAAAAVESAHPLPARIVNGAPTTDFPTVGLLVNGGQLCSATLIGCSTVLTAAHCICAAGAETFAQCRDAGLPDPSRVRFLSQHAMPAVASRVVVNGNYSFGHGGDLAIVNLAQPVTGISPAAFNRTKKPPIGTAATLVGFGRIGGDPDLFPSVGIKRAVSVETAPCPPGSDDRPAIPAANHVCVQLTSADDGGTCNGDSGGPLFVDLGAGSAVGGVASGLEADVPDCLPPTADFHTDVFRYRNFIGEQLADDQTEACGDLPPVGAPGTIVRAVESALQLDALSFQTSIAVPAGTRVLRVVMNGDLITADGVNDFDLFVNFGAPATPINARCSDSNPVAFGACEIDAPEAGTWHIAVEDIVGAGAFQLTMTLFGVPPCAGDCSGDGTVAINELVLGVGAASDGNVGACPAFDLDVDGVIRIDELISGVNDALLGCYHG